MYNFLIITYKEFFFRSLFCRKGYRTSTLLVRYMKWAKQRKLTHVLYKLMRMSPHTIISNLLFVLFFCVVYIILRIVFILFHNFSRKNKSKCEIKSYFSSSYFVDIFIKTNEDKQNIFRIWYNRVGTRSVNWMSIENYDTIVFLIKIQIFYSKDDVSCIRTK